MQSFCNQTLFFTIKCYYNIIQHVHVGCRVMQPDMALHELLTQNNGQIEIIQHLTRYKVCDYGCFFQSVV